MSVRQLSCPIRRFPASIVVSVVAQVVAVAIVAAAIVATDPAVAQADQARVAYSEPVDGVIVDGFRAPAHPYGAGNRGLDYRTVPGGVVRASADGDVLFAGQVGGSLHVTILHGDGLRTSYSFVESTAVVAGAKVRAGDVIATTGELFHFGVRDPDGTYLDPLALFTGEPLPVGARLVPGIEEGSDALVRRERRDMLATVVSMGMGLFGGAVSEASARWKILAHYVTSFSPWERARRAADALIAWYRSQQDCTPEGLSAPVIADRRIVIEVGGLGSSSDDAAIADLDTAALGYAPEDVVRFSYSGGRVPSELLDGSDAQLATVTTTTYDSADTQVDMGVSAQRLADVVEEVVALAPGVAVDIVAHSQGGVVSRLAVDELERRGAVPVEVENVVTIGSPHQGSDVATAVAAARSGPRGELALGAVRVALDATMGLGLDPSSESISQMSETSDMQAGLARRALPKGVRFTSIAARGDFVVPAPRTQLDGAARYVVELDGPSAHDSLPGASETTGQVALALAGLPPSCVDIERAARDFVVGEAVSGFEDTIGAWALTADAAGSLPGVPTWPGAPAGPVGP